MESVKEIVLRHRAANTLTPTQIGAKKVGDKITEEIFKRHMERRRILKIPQVILDAHPDKHFVFVNKPRLEKNGYYHPEGYRLFEVDETVEEKSVKENFYKGVDNFLHRNEMVLAYIPKEEYEQRELERAVIRGNVNLTSLIEQNPNIAKDFEAFAVHEEHEEKFVDTAKKEETEKETVI